MLSRAPLWLSTGLVPMTLSDLEDHSHVVSLCEIANAIFRNCAAVDIDKI